MAYQRQWRLIIYIRELGDLEQLTSMSAPFCYLSLIVALVQTQAVRYNV